MTSSATPPLNRAAQAAGSETLTSAIWETSSGISEIFSGISLEAEEAGGPATAPCRERT